MNKLKYAVKALFEYDYAIYVYKKRNVHYHYRYNNLLIKELNQDFIDASVERYKTFKRFSNKNELLCYVIVTIGV